MCLSLSRNFQDGTAKLHPEPEDKEMFIRSQIYNVDYDELINKTYDWPEKDMKHGFPVPVVRRDSMDDWECSKSLEKILF